MATPLVGVGDVLRHRTFCYLGNQVGINTRHLTIQAIAGGAPHYSDLILAIDDILAPLYKVILNENATYEGSDLVYVKSTAFPVPFTPWPCTANVGAGSTGGNQLPTQTCGLISYYSEFAGPGYRGRQYLPFPSAADQYDGPTSGPNAAYIARAASLLGATIGTQAYTTVAGATITVQWGIVRQTPAEFKGLFYAMTTGVASNKWATQRKRGAYGRTNAVPIP